MLIIIWTLMSFQQYLREHYLGCKEEDHCWGAVLNLSEKTKQTRRTNPNGNPMVIKIPYMLKS